MLSRLALLIGPGGGFTGLAQKAGFPVEKLNEIHGAWGDAKNPVLMMDDKLRDDLESW